MNHRTPAFILGVGVALIIIVSWVVYTHQGKAARSPQSIVRILDRALPAIYNVRATAQHLPVRMVKAVCAPGVVYTCRVVILGPSGPHCANLLVRAGVKGWKVLSAVDATSCPEAQRA